MIIISGPTGVGKSDIALSIAQRTASDIINIDVGQMYTPCTIGTAKPEWRNSPIKQYLFDYANTPRDVTVTEYRAVALETMNTIQADGHKPCFVGGSNFYIASLFFPPIEKTAQKEDHFEVDYEISWEELDRIDPERARGINPSDMYRIGRALAIYYTTGIVPSKRKPIYKPLAKHAVIILLTRDRDDLYARINQRVELMFDQGWVDEVRQLVDTPWQPFLMKKKMIGYDDIFRALAHDAVSGDALVQLKAVIAQKTRNYAKRQETFWRMLKKKIYDADPGASKLFEINLSGSDAEKNIEESCTYINTIMLNT